MKNNWGKLFLILIPIIAAIAVMIPTYRAYQLEGKLKDYRANANAAGNSADSLAIMEEFRNKYGTDLDEAKKNQLKLGLDLRGGMYVTLEVDVVKLLEESAQREAVDEVFLTVLAKTREELAESESDALDVFLKHFNEIARPKGKSLISYYDIGDFREATEENIIERLRENADDAINQAAEVIRQRIDQYGVAEPNIQQQGNNRIILELPGVENEDQMRSLLETTARLEFHLVRNNADIVRAFARIDNLLVEQNRKRAGIVDEQPLAQDTAAPVAETPAPAPATQTDTMQTAKLDADTSLADTSGADTSKANDPYAGMSEKEIMEKHTSEHPFTSLFASYFMQPGDAGQMVPFYYTTDEIPDGEYSFRIIKDSIARFNEILNRPEIRPLIPVDFKITIEAKPDSRLFKQSGIEVFEIFSLNREPELTGEVITNAQQSFDPTTNAPMVNMTMNDDGAERWARITGANIDKRVAIVLDDRVYSAPVVRDRILGGRSQISGMSNADEARLLEVVLKAGALKAPVQIIEERVVGPSLGQDSINSGITASLFAMLLVIAYMVFYYNKGGLVADFAVLLNVFLVIAVLTALKGTLTLPGIGGIILTIGMAVDANVLIFERIREEIAKGRSLRSAIDEGFSKALSAIIDGNITTGITAFILLTLASGPIQGFATTLLIGIISTLFTGILVTRALIELLLIKGGNEFNFGQPKQIQSI
ncbi:MAG: protein translocase subunit SecD [Ignavibacteriae bacterium HGW-Ignavibacteriae-1]|nr:MAG: protein translocase subunit SecD [Ignavibacteriae bacterium HGW-Ignavibacteriae-1]